MTVQVLVLIVTSRLTTKIIYKIKIAIEVMLGIKAWLNSLSVEYSSCMWGIPNACGQTVTITYWTDKEFTKSNLDDRSMMISTVVRLQNL